MLRDLFLPRPGPNPDYLELTRSGDSSARERLQLAGFFGCFVLVLAIAWIA